MLFSFSSLHVFPLFAGFYAAYAYRCSDKQVRISAQVPGRWAAADGVHGGKGRTDFVTSKALGRRKIPPGDRRADSGADGGAAAPRGVVLSFGAKESTKESQRHGDYGKKPFITHFDGGARNVARNGVGQLSPALGARSCSPFSAVKMGRPFSLRCLSPLCSPAADAGQTQMAVLGMFWCC